MANLVKMVFAHRDSQTQEYFMGHHGFGMFENFGWSGALFGWVIMFLFWALVVASILALIKYIIGGFGEKNNSDTRINKNKVYVCSECGFEYEEKEWAEKCQAWCREHKSCNLEITKFGVKP